MPRKDEASRKEYNREYYLKNKAKFDAHNHQYYLENSEKERERLREYRKLHPEYSKEYWKKHEDEKKEYDKQYYEQHKDKKKKYDSKRHKKFYKEHPDIIKERRIKDRLKHLDRILYSNKNYRMRKRAGGGNISKQEWIELCNRFENKCLCCGRTDVVLTIDHVMPLILGGKHSIENVQPLCRSCNSRKHIKYVDYRIQNG